MDDDEDLIRLKSDLLNDLPVEIWTESDIGQLMLQLAREGRCRHIRLNSTLGRFEKIE